jgi:transposase
VKTAGLIPEAQVRLCVIADGVPWIWNQVHALFPSAVEILDYNHCCEHL